MPTDAERARGWIENFRVMNGQPGTAESLAALLAEVREEDRARLNRDAVTIVREVGDSFNITYYNDGGVNAVGWCVSGQTEVENTIHDALAAAIRKGEMFHERWCNECAKDALYRRTGGGQFGCGILGRALFHDIGDPEYPSEWTHDDQGQPCCTAFEEETP